MTAEVLRRAASLMRERTEAVSPGRWAADHPAYGSTRVRVLPAADLAFVRGEGDEAVANAAHIASWHPAVALAVADWLDLTCFMLTGGLVLDHSAETQAAVAVARAYLGESA